jgi:hypothetical protein
MSLTDRRSLALGLLIAERLVLSPENVIGRARRNLDQLRSVHSDGSANAYLDRWSALIAGPVEALLRVLTSTDEEAVVLRHASPFAGILTERDRLSVIRATRRSAA